MEAASANTHEFEHRWIASSAIDRLAEQVVLRRARSREGIAGIGLRTFAWNFAFWWCVSSCPSRARAEFVQLWIGKRIVVVSAGDKSKQE